MSFSFTAAGYRHDVIASLKNSPTYDNDLGTAVRDAIISALKEDAGKHAGDGLQMVYVVKAFGHSGGRGTANVQLNVTVESFYQAARAEPEPENDGLIVEDEADASEPVAGASPFATGEELSST